MKTLKYSFSLLLLLIIPLVTHARENNPGIIPTPQHYQWQDGSTDFSNLTTIVLGNGTNDQDHFTAEQIQKDLSALFNIKVDIQSEKSVSNVQHAIVIGDPAQSDLIRNQVKAAELTDKMEKEGYVLKLNGSSVVIAGKSETGRFYGAMSLNQMLESSDSSTLKNISISDYPSMKFRGVSDDMSRGQVSTEENIKKIIRFMAKYKMNSYLPYMEDIIHFKDYPEIGEDRGRFTRGEVDELQNYAKKYHVDFIPDFETLGHQENLLNMKKFWKYAEYPGAASFNTQSDSAVNFVKQLMGDIIPWFDSDYFHIGGDESFDVGMGASRRAVNRYGLATVNANYYKKIYNYVKSHGKKVIMYGDMLLRNPMTLSQIPDDLIIMDWHYGATDEFQSTKVFAEAGQPFIVSPGISNWSRLYPNQSAAWVNTYHITMDGYKNGALGSITSSWGDMGGPNFRELNYRGYAYDAECAWNPKGADGETIDHRFNALFFGSTRSQLAGIQNLLNQVSEDLHYPEVWMHPFDLLDRFEDGNFNISFLNETTDIHRITDAVKRQVATVKPELKRNKQQLDYYTFVADLADWTAETVEYARWMKRISNNYITPDDRKPYQQKGIEWGSQLRDEVGSLQSRFDDLWLRTNRKANLDLINTLFKYQQIYLDNMVQSLRQNAWDTSYEIPSQFIAANGTTDDNAIRKVYLRKSFTLDSGKKIQHAYLQLVGDSHASLYLNGKKIGESVAKREGSLDINLKRSKYWDVADQLNAKSGNEIAARVISYQQIPQSVKQSASWLHDRPASANIYLKIEYADGNVQTVQTNRYWKTQTSEQKGWTSVNFDDDDWLPAAVVDGPATVYKPAFEEGLPSYLTF